MVGSFFALLAAILFALTAIFIRRAVVKVSDASIGMLISVPTAVPFFILVLTFTGQMRSVFSFSWQSYFWLSSAGILFFVIGRSLIYECTQLVGANIANILARVNIVVSVVFGITVLNEPLNWRLVIGVSLIIMGIILTGFNSRMLQNPYGQFSKIPVKALGFGIGCGLVVGIAPIFVKLGLKDSGSPIAGTFISFLAATIVLSMSLLDNRRRISIAKVTAKATGLFCMAGLLSCAANLTQYTALNIAPASVVTPLIWTSPVFLLVLSFLFNRNLEIFNKPVIIGTVSVVAGGVLLV